MSKQMNEAAGLILANLETSWEDKTHGRCEQEYIHNVNLSK